MDIKIQDKPLLVQGQYVDKIGIYNLYYNPLGYGGVTVVGPQSQELLSLCDGRHPVEQILRVNVSNEDVVMKGIEALASREVVEFSNEFTQELQKKSLKKAGISCWLHLTNRCNLACTYCYIHKSPGDMSLESGKLAIDKMIQTCRKHDIPIMNIKFSGGEPLLRIDLLKELIEYSQKTRGEVIVTYSMLTNGVLITQIVADYLKRNNIGVSVSLDGVGNVNDVCRHDNSGGGSFVKVVKGLDNLASSNIRPLIMITISSFNHKHLLALTQFLLAGGYRFRFSMERDCGSGNPELLNHIQELIQSLHQCYDYIETNLPEEDFFTLHVFGNVGFKKPARVSCSAGSNYFAIGHNRELGVCQMGLAKPFSTLEAPGDLLDNVRSANPELSTNIASSYPRCSGCCWRKSCAGGCPLQAKATFGHSDRPFPYCDVYREILPRILRIKGMQMIRNFEKNIPS